MIPLKPLAPTPNAAVSPEETSIDSLKLRIEKDIALLRTLALDPVDIAYSDNISFEVRPIPEGDRFSVYRQNLGGATIDYSLFGVDVDLYGENDIQPVHSISVDRDDLVEDPENELLKQEVLKVLGYNVSEDCDQDGLWVWVNVASLEGCEQSLDSQSQAIQAAWDDAGLRACAALETSWNGGSVRRQAELLLSAFNADEHPASAPSDTPN